MRKILQISSEIPLILVLFLVLIAVGVTFQYSVAASWKPWAVWHLLRGLIFLPIIFIVGSINLRWISRNAYLLFILSVLLLIFVQLFGHIGMGAKRWINLYFIKLQPSEIMKVAAVLFLSKYYSNQNEQQMQKFTTHAKAVFVMIIPIALVAKQPDLGTALLLFFLTCFMTIVCGLKKRYIVAAAVILCASPIFAWNNLHNYQKQRIISFINPESDPRGNGYHIIQSKIAIGSGGIKGKGFLNGTQSKLNFLPEKHTDFIFTSICEESGLIGSLSIIFSFIVLLQSIMALAYSCNNRFTMLLGLSIAFLIFEHAIINMSMVSGLIPVVGVPLPFISYGGSSLMAFSILIGLLANIAVNKNIRLPK